MKNTIKNYIFSILTLLIFTLISALILTIFRVNNIIGYNNSMIISNVISYILVAIISFIMGLKIKRHGLVHGFILSIMFLIINLIFFNTLSDTLNLIKVLSKSLIIIFFTILGVNKSK